MRLRVNFFHLKNYLLLLLVCGVQSEKNERRKREDFGCYDAKKEEKKTKMYMYYPIYSIYYSEVSQIQSQLKYQVFGMRLRSAQPRITQLVEARS